MSILIPAWEETGALMPVDKLEVHERGLKHKAISVFVLDGDKILLQQRAAHKYHTPGLWTNTCCTHPHWDEDDLTCAARRLDEEMGITGLTLQHRGEIEYRADVGGGLIEHEVVQVYTAEASSAHLPMALNPSEVQASGWLSLADLQKIMHSYPAKFTPWLRIYLREHLDLIFPWSVAAQ